ncbi:MAG: PilN domain-containing protein [Myxococcales bacterium]|nr:PilN domain-containing protein [Myxococcales bacterium]MDD9972296.1 PilN domain-containing protein [Myxococcales bacterium]
MIRINLLPEGRRAAAGGGSVQLWGVAYLLTTFAFCVGLFLIYLNQASALDEQRAKNAEVQRQIDKAKAGIDNLTELEAKLAESRKLESVATELQNARLGPARLLMELSRVLSQGRGPTVDPEVLEQMRRENPLAGYNPGWDIRRLWLTGFREEDGKCNMSGKGKTNEDVAEFLRRLSLSEVFDEVTLQATKADKDSSTSLTVVQFELSCKVRY